MKKRTKRMEFALKIIQTWASTDKCNQRTRDDAMRDIEKLAIKALRKKEEKMAKFSRDKGIRGELEVSAIISDLTGWRVKRKVRQHDGDSDLEGIPGWTAETKNCATITLPAWWRQAVAQAGNDTFPVLFYKIPRKGWRALWPISSMVNHDEQLWDALEYTCDTTIEAWAVVARDLVELSINFSMDDKADALLLGEACIELNYGFAFRPYREAKIKGNDMSKDEQAIEAEIQAKGLNAPRLSPEKIDAVITGEDYHVFPGTTLTVCCLKLRNGFTVTGESAAASPENFDVELGKKIARGNARDKIWALEGYVLREKLAA